MRTATIAIIVVAAMQGLPAQVSDATVVVRGLVVAHDDSRRPVRGARVTVQGGGSAIEPVFTDADGAFVVRAPAAARLVITKAGFAAMAVDLRSLEAAAANEILLARGASISGVVHDEAGFPIHDARVRARLLEPAPGTPSPPVMEFTGDTDESGAFRIGSLPAGRYSVHTERQMPSMDSLHAEDPGMDMRQTELRAALARRMAPMSEAITVSTAPGRDAFAALTHGVRGVIPPDAPIGGAASGVVLDAFGDPLEGVTLRLRRIRYSTSRLEVERSTIVRESDDRGHFRFFHVPPGRYVLEAVLDTPGYAPVYFPGVNTIAAAAPIVIGRRQEVPGLTMAVARTREARVFGFALDASGQPLRGTVSLTASARSGAPALPPRTVEPDATGVFEFLNVPPGEYVLRATATRARAPMVLLPRTDTGQIQLEAQLAVLMARERALQRQRAYASQFVTVDSVEPPPITIATTPAAIVTGRAVFDGDLTGIEARNFALTTMPDPDDGPIGTISSVVAEDGTFELAVSGTLRLSSGNLPRGWWLKSVEIDGVNAVETPIRFSGPRDSRSGVTAVFSSETGSVSGRVVDEGGDAVPDYRVIAFSTDRAKWFGKSPYVRITGGPEGDGGFTVPTVPPGDYYVISVDRIEGDGAAGDWQNPDVLAGLAASSTRVGVGAGERAAVLLRVVRQP